MEWMKKGKTIWIGRKTSLTAWNRLLWQVKVQLLAGSSSRWADFFFATGRYTTMENNTCPICAEESIVRQNCLFNRKGKCMHATCFCNVEWKTKSHPCTIDYDRVIALKPQPGFASTRTPWSANSTVLVRVKLNISGPIIRLCSDASMICNKLQNMTWTGHLFDLHIWSKQLLWPPVSQYRGTCMLEGRNAILGESLN